MLAHLGLHEQQRLQMPGMQSMQQPLAPVFHIYAATPDWPKCSHLPAMQKWFA